MGRMAYASRAAVLEKVMPRGEASRRAASGGLALLAPLRVAPGARYAVSAMR